jgi:hypothetical protein
MSTFTTKQGRWLLRFDIATMRAIRSRVGVDMFALIDDDRLSELGDDLATLADVVWIAIEPCATTRGVTRDAFFDGLAGDTLGDLATAFAAAVMEFLPEREPTAAEGDQQTENAGDREPFEMVILKVASRIPLDPGPYTLRELILMAKTAASCQWDHTASLLHLLACIHRSPKTPPPPFERFHPMLERKARRRGMSGDDLASMRSAFRDEQRIEIKLDELPPGWFN